MFNTLAQKKIVKEYSTITSIAEIIDVQLKAYGKQPCIRYDVGDKYKTLSFEEYHNYTSAMIRYFTDHNINQKVVATFCKNRIEWDMVGVATIYRANAIFPLDTKINTPELEHLLTLNPPDYMLVSFVNLVKIRALKTKLNLTTILFIADLSENYEDFGQDKFSLEKDEISIANIYQNYHFNGDLNSPLNVKISPAEQLNTDPNVVLGHYPTSGTTNLPKIVKITHQNIVHELNEAIDVINLRVNEDILNLGPYTHIATLVEWLMTKTRGFTVTYLTKEPDEDDVLEDEIKKLKRQGIRIKAMLGVPKLWIHLMKDVLEELKNKPVLNQLYHHLIAIEKHGKLEDISTFDKAKLAATRILLRNKLGGYFSYGISSSMKLDSSVVKIFAKLGVTLVDIYGATEASGIISRNKLSDINPGTCGRMIKGLEYRLTQHEMIPGIEKKVGMLEIRGNTISLGYLGSSDETHINADGYYETGDLVWIDDNDCLNVVGRKKELTKWDDGTYVDPQYLSNLMVRSIYIKDALVTRTNPEDKFMSVYVFPDKTRIAKDNEWKDLLKAGLSDTEVLKRKVEEAIDYATTIASITAPLSKQHIYILPNKLERTPTHKIKFLFELKRLHLAQKL